MVEYRGQFHPVLLGQVLQGLAGVVLFPDLLMLLPGGALLHSLLDVPALLFHPVLLTPAHNLRQERTAILLRLGTADAVDLEQALLTLREVVGHLHQRRVEIGRASCRESVTTWAGAEHE